MGSGNARMAEDRITRLERLYKESFGSLSFNYEAYPVRNLVLTEENSVGTDGSTACVVVASWQAPAGNITPLQIRIEISGKAEYISGSSLVHRIYGHVPGETITVGVTAVYTGDKFSSTVTVSKRLTGDSVAPGVPYNVSVTSGFRTLTISWKNPADKDLLHTEIWESLTGHNMESAERIAQAYGTEFVRANCGVLETRWYWLRSVDKNTNKSAFVGPYSGATNPIVLEDVPDGTIVQSKLAAELSSKIYDIDLNRDDLAELIAQKHSESFQYTQTAAEALLKNLLLSYENRNLLRDAGVIVDKETGRVYIYAVETLKGETESHIQKLQAEIDVHTNSIALRVTQAQLNSAIAAAQLDPNGVNLFDGLQEQITANAAQITLNTDGINSQASSITLLRSDLTGGLGRITTLEGSVSHVPGLISALAQRIDTDIDNLTQRTTTAESNISALEGKISSVVLDSSGTMEYSQKNAETMLEALWDQWREANVRRESIALAKTEMSAKVNENISAIAQMKTELAASIGSNAALLETVSRVSAGKARVYQQASAPGSPNIADLWIDGNSVIHRWNGASWDIYPAAEIKDLLEYAVSEAVLKTQAASNGRVVLAGIGVRADATTGSEVAVLADRFYVLTDKNGTVYQPFGIADGRVVINGSLIVQALKDGGYADSSGWLVANKIQANGLYQLGAGGKFIAGDGAIFQLGGGAVLIDSESAVLQLKDPNNLETGDYLRASTGQLVTYKYLNGAYRPMKALNRVTWGQNVANNSTVQLDGYWPSTPKIIVSPCTLQSYSGTYRDQPQTMDLKATDILWNSVTGMASFRPVAQLIIAAGATQNTNSNAVSSGSFTTLTEYGASSTVPANTASIDVSVQVYAARYANTTRTDDRDGLPRTTTTTWCFSTSCTIYLNIDGVDNYLGSVTFPKILKNGVSPPFNKEYLSADQMILSAAGPSFGQVVSNSKTLNNTGSSHVVYVKAIFSTNYQEQGTRAAGGLSDSDVVASTGCWMRMANMVINLSGATLLATGTLNYMAVAE